MRRKMRLLVEYVALTREQIRWFREMAPDIGDNAFLIIYREGGFYLVAWEDDTTLYEFAPMTKQRRQRDRDHGTPWTKWK